MNRVQTVTQKHYRVEKLGQRPSQVHEHQNWPSWHPGTPRCTQAWSYSGRAWPCRGRGPRPYRSSRLPCHGAPAPYCRHSAARPYALCSARHASSPARLAARIATYRRMQMVVSWVCAHRVWTRSFSTCVPTRWARLAFLLLENHLNTVWSRHLFLFYFKGEKQNKKKKP